MDKGALETPAADGSPGSRPEEAPTLLIKTWPGGLPDEPRQGPEGSEPWRVPLPEPVASEVAPQRMADEGLRPASGV